VYVAGQRARTETAFSVEQQQVWWRVD